MGTGFAKKKKQAKAFQQQMAKMQEQIQQTEVTGSAGNGLVTVTLNGNHEMTALKIKPDCVDPEDVEGLEDLILAAFKDAKEKLDKETPDIGSMAGGMGLPPGLF